MENKSDKLIGEYTKAGAKLIIEQVKTGSVLFKISDEKGLIYFLTAGEIIDFANQKYDEDIKRGF